MIQSKAKQKAFKDLMDKLQIQPAKEKSNAEKFYEWLTLKVKNVHTSNDEVMIRAFDRIIEY